MREKIMHFLRKTLDKISGLQVVYKLVLWKTAKCERDGLGNQVHQIIEVMSFKQDYNESLILAQNERWRRA